MHEDNVRETPPAVVGAVALGTVPLPFLAVYAVLFLVHGSVHPVQPPDVTSTKGGEFAAGWVALAVFVVLSVSLLWLVNGRRRWPFALMQLALLATVIDFLVDDTAGGRFISALVALTCALSLVLSFAPQAWRHVDCTAPPIIERVYGARPGLRRRSRAGSAAGALAQSSEPTAVQPASLRRRRSADDAPASSR